MEDWNVWNAFFLQNFHQEFCAFPGLLNFRRLPELRGNVLRKNRRRYFCRDGISKKVYGTLFWCLLLKHRVLRLKSSNNLSSFMKLVQLVQVANCCTKIVFLDECFWSSHRLHRFFDFLIFLFYCWFSEKLCLIFLKFKKECFPQIARIDADGLLEYFWGKIFELCKRFLNFDKV